MNSTIRDMKKSAKNVLGNTKFSKISNVNDYYIIGFPKSMD